MQDTAVQLKGEFLKDRTIAFCISGGIASVKCVEIIRELRRYGARVKAYMTETSQKFVGKAAIEWACDEPVVDSLSGGAEHICKEDLVLVCPVTLNIINSIFAGVANNPMLTLISSAIGMKKPILIVPTMHDSMFENPILKENLKKADEFGITLIQPKREESKAKMPDKEEIAAKVCREISSHKLKGRNVLVTGGPTRAYIDDVRFITNMSSGKTSIAIADYMYKCGINVTLLLGMVGIKVPSYLDVVYYSDNDSYQQNVYELLEDCQAGVFAAAVADYIPADYKEGKISSSGALDSIKMREAKKVIKEVRTDLPRLCMVTFKYEDGVTVDELLSIAQKRISEGYEMVVANRAEDYRIGHKAYIVSKDGILFEPSSNFEIARDLVKALAIKLG